MSETTIVLITLIAYKIILLGVGWWASKRVSDESDFFLASGGEGGGLGAWTAGLSYAASTSSAWVLLGFTGMVFTRGAVGLWLVPGIFGGYLACISGGFSSHADFIEGLQLDFKAFHIVYAFIKTFLFAMLLATIPSYHGYFMKGGALDVGKASTTSFVWTSVTIIITNTIVTNLLLT